MQKTVKSNDEDKAKLVAKLEQLTTTCNSYRNELQLQADTHASEVVKLHREKETLQLQMCRLQDKLDHWKSTCMRQQNENLFIAQSKLISKENNALKQDIEVFKTVIRRLNKELAFYQEKLRKISSNDMPRFSSDSNTNSIHEDSTGAGGDSTKSRDNLENPTETLLPLLTAYDEIIEEKNEIIRDHEQTMIKFKSKVQKITQENEQLHTVIAECKEKGSVSMEEWKSLYDNAIVVLEENDLLHEKVKILSQKLNAVESGQIERVEKLKKKISLLEEEKTKLKTGLDEMDRHTTFLTDQVSKMSITIQQRIPREEHEASVNECHRLFNDLKTKYSHERTVLTEKLNEAGVEKEILTNQLTSTNSEITKFQDTIKNLEKSNLEYAGSLVVLKKELSISVKALQVNETNVKEMMRIAEAMVKEKQALEKAYNEQKLSTSKMMSVRSQELNLVKECEEKLQAIEVDYERKLDHHKLRAKKYEDVLETIAERHQADLCQLHELIKEKNIHIEKLNNEKKQLMEDLETVWKASTRDKKNSLLNSSHKTLIHAPPAPDDIGKAKG